MRSWLLAILPRSASLLDCAVVQELRPVANMIPGLARNRATGAGPHAACPKRWVWGDGRGGGCAGSFVGFVGT